MEEKKKKKGCLPGCLIAFAVLAVAGMILSGIFSILGIHSSDNPEEQTSVSASADSGSASGSDSNTTESNDTSTSMSTQLHKVFTSTVHNCDIDSFQYGKNEGELQVEFSYTSVPSEQMLLKEAISDYVNFCLAAYEADSTLERVTFNIYEPVIDAKGNSDTQKVVGMQMTREIFNTYNWENMRGRPVYDSFSTDCEYFYVLAGVLNKVDTSSITYIG